MLAQGKSSSTTTTKVNSGILTDMSGPVNIFYSKKKENITVLIQKRSFKISDHGLYNPGPFLMSFHTDRVPYTQ